jgi:hypothetical protein
LAHFYLKFLFTPLYGLYQLDTQAQIDSGVVQYDFSIECYLKGGEAE